jgi:ABC-type sugar transport system permease subunit
LWLLVVPAACTFLGLVIAVLTDRIWWGTIAKSLIFLPLAISFVGASVIWKFIYEYRGEGQTQIGILNAIVQWLGGAPQVWISTPFWNNFFLMVILIWIQTGFAMVILSAALRGIPEETIEAAVIDGANPFQIFWKIMVPQIWGTIIVVWTTITILVLKVFDIVLTMTNGQWNSQVLANLMFDWMFRGGGDFGKGATIAVIIMLAVLPIMIWNIRQANKKEGSEMAQASGNSAGKTGLSKWGVHLAVLFFVTLWTIPTLGILVTSLRDKNQIVASGWWNSFFSSTTTDGRLAAADKAVQEGDKYIIKGSLFEGGPASQITAFGTRAALQPSSRSARSPISATANRCRSTPTAAMSIHRPSRSKARAASASIMRRNATKIHHRELSQCADVGRRRTILPELADGHHSGHHHSDHDRRLRRLCAGVDAVSRPALLIATIIGLLVVPLQMALIPCWNSTTASAISSVFHPRPISASGWRIPASACPSPSICCAAIWPACRAN